MKKQDLVNQIQTTDLCCHNCGSTNIVKRGKVSGLQRYWCKSCNCTFNLATKTVLANSKTEAEKYLKYVELMQYQVSIRKAAKICGISVTTSFHWRHKFLDSLKAKANSEHLEGCVESDGTFLTLSFKGSRLLPRDSHKRGNDTHIRGISFEKVCINTACSREAKKGMANVIAVPTNLGPENTKDLRALFTGRICCNPDSILCTDQKVCFKNLAESNGYAIMQFNSKKHDSRGNYSLARINQYHQSFKDFLAPTKGVATKYLQNYINWHNYLNRADTDFQKEVMTPVNETRSYTIRDRPPIPFPTKYDGFFKVIGEFSLLKQINDNKEVKNR